MRNQIFLFLLVINFSCSTQTVPSENQPSNDLVKTDSVNIKGESPTNQHNIPEEYTSTFNLVNTGKADFEKAKKEYKDSLIPDTLTFKKVNGQLRLKINQKWKPYVTFQDTLINTDNDEIREYKYLGQYKELNHYLVEGYFWEHYESYLIDKESGKITTTWTRPYISPGKKFLANLSMAYGLEGPPNGIQVWKIDRNSSNQSGSISINKYIEIDQQIWAPFNFYWESDNAIIIKTTSVKKFWELNGEPKETDFSFLRLTLK